MALPSVSLEGNLTRDMDLRWTASGKAIGRFSVACNDRRKQPDGSWADGETTFVSVTVWEKKAEALAEVLTKGTPVVVTGRLACRKYDKDGQTREAWEVTADTVGVVPRPGKAPAQQRADEAWGYGPGNEAQADEPPF